MKLLLTGFLLLFSLVTHAQMTGPATVWLKGFGGDIVDDIQPPVIKTQDGGFIVRLQSNSTMATGSIDSFCQYSGGKNIFLKYNAEASILEWSKCYEINFDTFLFFPFPAPHGGFIIGGMYNSGGGLYICRHDISGNIVWSHGFSKGNAVYLNGMIACDDGGYIMMGTSNYTDTNVAIHYGSWMDPDFFIMKVDSLGNKVWAKVIGGTGADGSNGLNCLIAAPGDGCYIAGVTTSNDYDCTGNHGGREDAYVVRLDKNGNILWHRDLGGTRDDNIKNCATDGKGGILITGSTSSMDGDVLNPIDTFGSFWAVNLDSNGNVLWNNCYGGKDSYASSICKAVNGDVWMAGVSKNKFEQIDTNYWGDDAWIVHADNSGNFINAMVLGSTAHDRATTIHCLPNGNVIAGGFYGRSDGLFSSLSFFGADDAFLTVLKPYPTGIQQVSARGRDCIIFPNPVSNEENIKVTAQGNHNITIYTLLGKVVYKTAFIDALQIFVNNWAKGIYYVQVTGDDYSNVQKLIIE